MRVRLVLLPAILVSLTAGAAAEAATLKLACAGSGPRNEDSAGTVLCAAAPGRSREIRGTVRDDAGKPVAGAISVQRSVWTPAKSGSGYSVSPTGAPQLITARADGSFSFKASPASSLPRESFKVTLAADPALGIAGGVTAQAEVLRRLKITVSKRGGGRVRFTVRGIPASKVKRFFVLDATGNYLPGQRTGRKLNGKGQVTFSLGARATGTYSYFVDCGRLGDLVWPQDRRAAFRLKNGR